MTSKTIRILWFRPARWQNVSVRRERITEKLRSRGVKVELVDATARNFLRHGLQAARNEYDVVIGNVRLGLYGGYLVARLTRTPFIGDVSDTIDDIDHLPKPLYLALRRYERFVLRHSDANVFLPETIKGMSEYGIGGEIAGNAVDYEKFADPEPEVVNRAREILHRTGADPTRPIAIYLGSMPKQLHFEEIIEAAELTDRWQFVIVGEGPMEETVNRASDRLDNFFFPGAFEYDLMPGFLSHADAGFCLEYVERPLKISEYGAAGLPTLAAYGKLEAEFSEEELYFIEPGPEEIANALDRILDNPEEAEDRAANLREHTQQYSWDEVGATYYELITSLTAG